MNQTASLLDIQIHERHWKDPDHLIKVPGLSLHQLQGGVGREIFNHLHSQIAGDLNGCFKAPPRIIRMAVQFACILINCPSKRMKGLDEEAE